MTKQGPNFSFDYALNDVDWLLAQQEGSNRCRETLIIANDC